MPGIGLVKIQAASLPEIEGVALPVDDHVNKTPTTIHHNSIKKTIQNISSEKH
jgi:hypothetical protein